MVFRMPYERFYEIFNSVDVNMKDMGLKSGGGAKASRAMTHKHSLRPCITQIFN